MFEAVVKNLQAEIPGNNFALSMVPQPLPAFVSQHSATRGGNMFGLDRINDDCILLVWAVETDTPELMAASGFPALKGAIDDIETYADGLDANIYFRYLNYCDGSQDPLGSYGEENIKKMREAAAKYDPTEVFQTRVPGGFNISHVK